MIPLQANIALAELPTLKEPRLIEGWVLWLEQRSYEGGRTTAFIRPFGHPDFPALELTPRPINLRSRVHGYGGGALATESNSNNLFLAWIDDQDGCLWFQSWIGLQSSKRSNDCFLKPVKDPICLSCKGDFLLADGLIDLVQDRWLGVMEFSGKDFLVSFSLDKENQDPEIIYSPEDFIGYASLSPSGDQIVWVEWQKPSMPWDISQLWWAKLDDFGEIREKKCIAGSLLENDIQVSVFQPIWLSTDELVVVEDINGWWNIMINGSKLDLDLPVQWRRLWPMEAEAAMPQWVYGMSTISSDGANIFALTCKDGSWTIHIFTADGFITEFKQPFTDLAFLDTDKGKGIAIASNSINESGLLEFDVNHGTWQHNSCRSSLLKVDQISVPEPFWFEGFKERLTHAWYYPPSNGKNAPPPLLVKSHSGPTGMARTGLNLSIQFWTSRGWGVVDVNYGGSTGFGRKYRERLKSGWGEVDVFDCAAAAKALVKAGKADPNLVAIEGGSAGGFTTLACLCFTDVFSVGACRYAVSDLTAMAHETHRFEAGYLDYLVGSFDENIQRYKDRSPINHAAMINCPVIFFQGLKDTVVSPEQTERMAKALRVKNIPVEVHTFAEEGHGFRGNNAQIKVLELTECFFRKHLGL